MDMRVGLYPLTGEPGCGSGGTGTAWKSGNSGSRLQAVYNQGHASVVVLLLADERLDPNIVNQDGSRALFCAAVNGDTSVVKLLLADERLDPNIADKSGITALILAAHQRARLGSDAAACRRAPGPKHRRPGWQHGTHLCRSQSLRLGGEAAACRRADGAVF